MRPTNYPVALVVAALLSAGGQAALGDGTDGARSSFASDRDRPTAVLAAMITRDAVPRSAVLVRASAPGHSTLDQVIAAMRGVPAGQGIRELARRGFVRLRRAELRRLITGNTLKLMNSYSYYSKDSKIRLKETSLGGGLESAGTWSIKDSNLCHSVREDHEFCSGLFFSGAELVCWPAIGWLPDDIDYLRRCAILAGDQTRKAPGAMAAIVTRKVAPRPAALKVPSRPAARKQASPSRPAASAPPLPAPPLPAPPSMDAVLAAMRSVPARNGIGEMAERGFARLDDGELRRLISGNTLKLLNTYSHFAKNKKIRLKETSPGGGLESTGTWSIKDSNLCHSVREDHEFCSGLFFREAELLCWPGIGWSPDDIDYLRRCAILAGDQTRKAPGAMAAIVTRKVSPRPTVKMPARPAPAPAVARLPAPPPARSAPPTLDQVIAAMRGVPAGEGIRKMAQRGFTRLRGEALKKRITGSTLKMVNSFSYYGGDQRIRIRETSLGGGLKSAGTWYIKGSNLCHSVREDHEFCSGLFFRGAELLCWPGIDWSPEDLDYLRTCRILAGNKAE